jgi:hypothetical protein
MGKIPSTEKTNDFIYRVEIKKSDHRHGHDDPNLLDFELAIEPAGAFHSMDVTILRDGQRATDVEFRSFELWRDPNMSYFKMTFHENTHRITDHDYLLTIILRYLV